MFQHIREFHLAFGHPVADLPGLPDQATRDLRIRLLSEELNEFCAAYSDDNVVEMADGLADMCVIICGTMVTYGIVPGDGTFESPYPDGSRPFLAEPHRADFAAILYQGFTRYELAEHDDDLEEIKHYLMNLLMDVCGVAVNLRIPLNAVFAEVHRANLSKLMPDGSVKYREDGKILKPEGWQPPDIAAVLAKHTELTVNSQQQSIEP